MNAIKVLLYFCIFLPVKAFAYTAICVVHNGIAQHEIDIRVESKVLILGNSKLPFLGKSNNGWYLYGNDHSIYKLGPFYKPNSSSPKQFLIDITYSNNLSATGSCLYIKKEENKLDN